jgi:hypothetical protein
MSYINWGSESQEQREARRRFEEEQILFEQAIRFAQASAVQAGGVGSSKKDPSTNLYVEDGYIDNYFE